MSFEIQGHEIQKSLDMLEREMQRLRRIVDSANETAKKASQDLARMGTGGQGGSSVVSIALIYTTSVIGARSGNVAGSGTFQFVNLVGITFTATGNAADSAQTCYNVTAGSIGTHAYGLAAQIRAYGVGGDSQSKWICLVGDCFSTTSPAAPATP